MLKMGSINWELSVNDTRITEPSDLSDTIPANIRELMTTQFDNDTPDPEIFGVESKRVSEMAFVSFPISDTLVRILGFAAVEPINVT